MHNNSPLNFLFKTSIPVITILAAPIDFAINNVASPMGPLPRIKSLVPIATPARLHACTPQDRGSSSAPSSKETWSGNLENKIYCHCSSMRPQPYTM